jgi:hypothetical protein
MVMQTAAMNGINLVTVKLNITALNTFTIPNIVPTLRHTQKPGFG